MTALAWRAGDRDAPWIVGNWKMNGDAALFAAIDAAATIAAHPPRARIALALPHTMIATASRQATGVVVGAQDVHHARNGAFTGSVSAAMLRDAGAAFTIVGHSERRAACGETAAQLRAKIECAAEAGLAVLACCGETAAIRDAGGMAEHVRHQLAEMLPDGIDPTMLAIAYEPCWAIGAAAAPPAAPMAEPLAVIGAWLRARFGVAGAGVPVLYGGAVDASFAAVLRCATSFDGVLVGRASLDAAALMRIASRFGGADVILGGDPL